VGEKAHIFNVKAGGTYTVHTIVFKRINGLIHLNFTTELITLLHLISELLQETDMRDEPPCPLGPACVHSISEYKLEDKPGHF
jgi:hypothetical protein